MVSVMGLEPMMPKGDRLKVCCTATVRHAHTVLLSTLLLYHISVSLSRGFRKVFLKNFSQLLGSGFIPHRPLTLLLYHNLSDLSIGNL